jgi:hypothetical protein
MKSQTPAILASLVLDLEAYLTNFTSFYFISFNEVRAGQREGGGGGGLPSVDNDNVDSLCFATVSGCLSVCVWGVGGWVMGVGSGRQSF